MALEMHAVAIWTGHDTLRDVYLLMSVGTQAKLEMGVWSQKEKRPSITSQD